MALVDVRKLDGITNPEVSGIGLFHPHDQPEKGGFPGAVRTDDPDHTGRGE